MAIDLVDGGLLGDGRYRLERMLGSGGMATVWLAHDEVLRRNVAIKILSDVLALDAGYVRRFEREAQVAAGLSHPHLVNVFDFSSAQAGRPYLVMEYVEGVTVADEIDHGVRPEGRRLAEVLLEALSYIHGAGIIHRDLKPANILVGKDGRYRLTDFGIAQAPDSTRLTATGNVVGTARYMPPEVLHGDPATARSDLYACGVVLRECLSERSSPELRVLVDRLTAESAGDRPASAEAALDLLNGAGAARSGSLPATERLSAGSDTAPTERVARPSSDRSEAPVAVPRTVTIGPRALWGAAVAIVIVILIAALSGGDGPSRSASPSAAPSNAPIGAQIDALRREVRRAAGH